MMYKIMALTPNVRKCLLNVGTFAHPNVVPKINIINYNKSTIYHTKLV